MRIGVIAAMDSEMNNLIQHMKNVQKKEICGMDFYLGAYNQNEVILVVSGVGKVNAAITAALLIDEFRPEYVINTGIAGGGLGVLSGDLLIADKFSYSDMDCVHFGYEFGTVPGMPKYFYADEQYIEKLKNVLKDENISYKTGEVLTADTFRMSKHEIKNSVSNTYAVEMEGAAIAQACYKLHTPFVSIRIISDVLDSENHIEDYNAFEKEAALLSSNITMKLLEKAY